MTHGNSLHLADFLNLVASRSDLESLEDGLDLGLRQLPLLRVLDALNFARALEHDLVLVVFVE